MQEFWESARLAPPARLEPLVHPGSPVQMARQVLLAPREPWASLERLAVLEPTVHLGLTAPLASWDHQEPLVRWLGSAGYICSLTLLLPPVLMCDTLSGMCDATLL